MSDATALRRATSAIVPGLVTVIAVLSAWELAINAFDVAPLVIPAPSAILNEIADRGSVYFDAALVTVAEAAAGFVIALLVSGVMAAAMVHLPVFDRAVQPLQIALRCTPVVAFAPALMLWLGFGWAPKIVMAAVITFAPFLVNLLTGFRSIDTATLEVLRSVNASRREIFFTLRVPHALPFLFSAARVCISLGLIGAVVAEWSGSSEGLGYMIIAAQKNLETTVVWACVAVLTVLGITLTLLLSVVENRVLRWNREERNENQ